MKLNEKQMIKFIEKIIVANKDDIFKAQKELYELARKLQADDVSHERIRLVEEVAENLLYADFIREGLPLTKEYLEEQIEKVKISKRKEAEYHIPDFIYERANAIIEAHPGSDEAKVWAENVIKDAYRGCFR